jgi:hypothetical protein
MNQQKSSRSNRVSFHSDVDGVSNHKPSPYQTQLSIVEESENPEGAGSDENRSKKPTKEDNSRVPIHTPESSVENITALHGNKRRHYLTPDSADRHEKEPLNNSRRPSVILQELLTRRPSALLAQLRRPSFMNPFRKPDDPNDPANKPEAIEQRRKNRRIGK